jgi:hypothetical protein
MDYSCSRENVTLLLAALEVILSDLGAKIDTGVGIRADASHFNKLQTNCF